MTQKEFYIQGIFGLDLERAKNACNTVGKGIGIRSTDGEIIVSDEEITKRKKGRVWVDIVDKKIVGGKVY